MSQEEDKLKDKDKELKEKDAVIKELDAVIGLLKRKASPRSLSYYRSRFL